MKTAMTIAIAGAALIALPAMAQTNGKTTPPSPSTTGSAPNTTSTTPSTTNSGKTAAKAPMFEMKSGQWRATKLKGLDVYNASNDKIGSISEMIVDRDGKIAAVVIGVGGFLGMGEHDVAVPFDQVKWVDEPVKTASTTGTSTTGTSTTSRNGASGTSTAPSTAPSTATTPPATSGSRATTADRTADTTTSSRDHSYPDHAVVNMTKDQLKALPEVKYERS